MFVPSHRGHGRCVAGPMHRVLLVAFVLVVVSGCIRGGPNDGRAHESPTNDADSDARADGLPSTPTACSPTTGEGDACSVGDDPRDAFCRPNPCTDECSFCDGLHCTDGTWEAMEVFPSPRSYCASAECGPLTCGKGEFCVRASGADADAEAEPSYECAKFPPRCFDCTCASEAACPEMTKTCTPDPETQKPMVDCAAP